MVELSAIGLLVAFTAGAISFLSPCVLPLVPGYVSYIAGDSSGGHLSAVSARWPARAIGLSLCFVFGFTTIFVLLGASATMLGQILLSHKYELNIAGGAIVVAFGVTALGLVRLPWLQREFRLHPAIGGGRPLSAYLLGLAFAFGWSPCIGPILGAILTLGAASATVAKGIVLLLAYSLGLGAPFVLSAAFTGALTRRLKSFGRAGRRLRLAAGSTMIVMGLAMITGSMSTFSFWLLNNFPILARIG
jgi:cytochrome c-type biogenesis protein